MGIYLGIAAIYALFGIFRGVPLHIAAGLGLIWPFFLFIGLWGTLVKWTLRRGRMYDENNGL